MHPILFQLHLPLVGSFTVSSFGAMMAGAFLAGQRVAIEMFRATDDRWLGPFTTAQLVSVAVIGVGFVVMRRERAVAPVRTAVSADTRLPVGSRAQ